MKQLPFLLALFGIFGNNMLREELSTQKDSHVQNLAIIQVMESLKDACELVVRDFEIGYTTL